MIETNDEIKHRKYRARLIDSKNVLDLICNLETYKHSIDLDVLKLIQEKFLQTSFSASYQVWKGMFKNLSTISVTFLTDNVSAKQFMLLFMKVQPLSIIVHQASHVSFFLNSFIRYGNCILL
jgi:hypothetical protein